jgi:DNA-directed RNA polymerase specialized sigma24 family protein
VDLAGALLREPRFVPESGIGTLLLGKDLRVEGERLLEELLTDGLEVGDAIEVSVADLHEEIDPIERAFEQFAEDHRDVILKAKVLGVSRAEIARQIGRSEGAVRAHLFRALSAFARSLDR